MGLLTSDKTVKLTNVSTTHPLSLVLSDTREAISQPRSKWTIGLITAVAFVGGFGVSFFSRPAVQVAEARIQVTDFRIEIPDGQTTVTILSRDLIPVELARLNIRRQDESITGVPEVLRRVAPRERLSAADAAFFRRELTGVFAAADNDWQRANKIREWLAHRPYHLGFPGLSTRVPREAYEQMTAGRPVLCGNLAEIYVGLCEAAGINARVVGLSVAVQNGLFGVDTHAGAEIWSPDMGGWIYEDPTFNCYWKVEDKPVGALEIHDAFMLRQRIAFGPDTADTERRLRSYYMDPRLYFRHISYEYKPGGTVLYYADQRLEPLSVTDKNWIHTSDSIAIQKLDTEGQLIVERRGEIAPGIFAQLLGHELFIRDRREQSQGIRVRSTSGVVEGCAYLHQRAEDLGLFDAINIIKNPAFRLTGSSGNLAAGWTVSGPVEAMTVAGGQAIAALAGARLWQRVKAQPHSRYLLYARISVSRGVVNWSLSDPAQGARSAGSVEPEKVSEIVSDVVGSESGYLDVAFDVPSGGAFRVLDVIVAEAPRFGRDSNRTATALEPTYSNARKLN